MKETKQLTLFQIKAKAKKAKAILNIRLKEE